jgi:putative transposase
MAGVSRASFYRTWEGQEPDEAEMALRDVIQRLSVAHRCYGYRRITRLVKLAGLEVGAKTVRRVMREDNLLAVRQRKFRVTTNSDHPFAVYPNLAQHLQLTAVGQLWVADLTYIRLRHEFVYLAVALDAYSRKVVGWALGRQLDASLPLLALERALDKQPPPPGWVHHSDRGSQYASNLYVQRLEKAGAIMSMSRPAKPWENGRCESFIKTLKHEQLNAQRFTALGELEASITEFIEQYYNPVRLHSALGYRSPMDFERAQAEPAKPAEPARPNPLTPPDLTRLAALSFQRHEEIYPNAAKS